MPFIPSSSSIFSNFLPDFGSFCRAIGHIPYKHINMASGETSAADSKGDSAKSTPRDARAMKAILKEMGVEDFEPRVINQMLEFTYRKSKCQKG